MTQIKNFPPRIAMKTMNRLTAAPRRLLAAACALAAATAALAFPPSPHHLFEGTVRDEMGNPIAVTNAIVVFETLAGSQVRTVAAPGLAPGINYRLAVPMDAGLTADNYQPTAARPTLAFRFKVLIHGVTYLPIELKGAYAGLGNPAETTRLDLTLGEDLDGDGLPDAWERMLLAMLGGGSLADIDPNADSDGDGLTNLQEYLAGTYAFDPEDGFRLDIVGAGAQGPLLEFLAIRGRTYTLMESTDLQTWTPVAFRVPADGAAAEWRNNHRAHDTRPMRVESRTTSPALVVGGEEPAPAAPRFFKVHVQ